MRTGIGAPGAASPASRLLRSSNSICLNNRLLRKHLETVLDRAVRLASDADGFARSEAIGLVPPRHGHSSGVRGADWLWPA